MQQLCYVSQSKSKKADLVSDLTNILSEARNFNTLNQINGVLYFADGYFFQCLEGDSEKLKMLLKKLYKDPRHENIRLFEIKDIEVQKFSEWSMKYVSKRSDIQGLCQRMGFDEFKPYEFKQHHVDLFLNELVQQEQEAA